MEAQELRLTVNQQKIDAALSPLMELVEALKLANSLLDELARKIKELELEIEFRGIEG